MSVVFNFWGGVSAIILFLIVGGYKNLSFPHDISAWLIMIFAFAMYAMFERGRFLAAKLLEASVFAIISNLGLAVAYIGSFLIYSEELTAGKIWGAGLVVVSLLIVSFVGKIKKISIKGVLVGVAVYIFLGLGWMLDKWGALTFNPNSYALLGWIIPVFFVYFPYVKRNEIVYEAKRSSWKIILLAIINVLAYYFQLLALSTGQAIVVIPLVQTFMLVTVLLGIFLLGEKDRIWQKIIAAVIGFAGAYLLIVA